LRAAPLIGQWVGTRYILRVTKLTSTSPFKTWAKSFGSMDWTSRSSGSEEDGDGPPPIEEDTDGEEEVA
jgi:hypothetical protein